MINNAISSLIRRFREKHFDWAYLVILFIALIAHGLLLLNDWEYWDGPAVHQVVESRDLIGELKHYGQNGVPIMAVYLWVMGLFPNITFAFKLVGFLCFVLSAAFAYRIGLLSGMVSRLESLSIAVIAMIYPVFQVSVISDLTGYMIGNLCFITAVMFVFQAENKVSSAHWRFRIFSWVFFFLAFNFLNSVYVFYFGFLLFWVLYILRKYSLTINQFLRNFIWRRIDYLIMPFLSWSIRAIFYPVSGEYAESGTYAFIFETESLQLWTGRFLNFAIVEPYSKMITRHWWLTLTVVVLCLGFVLWKPEMVDKLTAALKPQLRYWALFGAILLVAALFPYVAVGRGPITSIFSKIPFDTDTRHTLLIALPLAILIVGFIRSHVITRKPLLAATSIALLVVMAVESCIVHIENYVDWQIRSVKDQSLIAQLKENEEVDRYSIIWVDDFFPAGGYRFYANKAFYVYSEWHWIADFIWPEYGHTLIDAGYRGQEPGHQYWNYETDRAGCQAVLRLERNPDAGSDLNVLAHYYYYKFFAPLRLERYLKSSDYQLTSIQLSPLERSEATNCVFPIAQ